VRLTPRDRERFEKRVSKGESCWLWAGATNTRYGVLPMRKADGIKWGLEYAHRLSWEFENGPVPSGLFVCHHCDVPLCVRPDHLFLGTTKENGQDMARKKRDGRRNHPEKYIGKARGERNARSKLTEEMVHTIRRRLIAGERGDYIANDLGIHRARVTEVKIGKAWGWLNTPGFQPTRRRGKYAVPAMTAHGTQQTRSADSKEACSQKSGKRDLNPRRGES
jgi:HNH endonuclease